MKKLVSSLFIVAGLFTFGFAQEANEIAISNGEMGLVASKISGEYEFTMPSNLTKEKFDASAKYYTTAFSAAYDEGSHKMSLKMIENEQKNRYVIARLLTACQVKYIRVDDTSIKLYEFIEKYLK